LYDISEKNLMNRILLNEDVYPLSKFRANATGLINKVKMTRRPIVVTQHGKSAAVLLGVDEYEDLIEHLELVDDIGTAKKQLAAGKGMSHESALKTVMDKIVS